MGNQYEKKKKRAQNPLIDYAIVIIIITGDVVCVHCVICECVRACKLILFHFLVCACVRMRMRMRVLFFFFWILSKEKLIFRKGFFFGGSFNVFACQNCQKSNNNNNKNCTRCVPLLFIFFFYLKRLCLFLWPKQNKKSNKKNKRSIKKHNEKKNYFIFFCPPSLFTPKTGNRKKKT